MTRALRLACPLVVAVLFVVTASAQSADPALEKLRTDYEQAWKKGDAKALASHYAEDALTVGADGVVTRGRANLEKQFAANFAGPWKGTSISITARATQALSQEISVSEGTFAISGVTGPDGKPAPLQGQYVNTIVKRNNAWLIAGSAAFVPQAAAGGPKMN